MTKNGPQISDPIDRAILNDQRLSKGKTSIQCAVLTTLQRTNNNYYSNYYNNYYSNRVNNNVNYNNVNSDNRNSDNRNSCNSNRRNI